jgi:hypothetical protein
MLGLIIVASMVPGLLIGLRRTTAIDYDAVAYRTATVLVEDPGWPAYNPWELEPNKEGVIRLGLAISKDSPNILSLKKIEKFNNSDFLSDSDFRQKMIFGDYPYRFNVTLTYLDDHTSLITQGDPLPNNLTGYGSIQRLVKIKNTSDIVINLSKEYAWGYNVSSYTDTTLNQTFRVRLDLREYLNKSINPAYEFDPRVEPIDITIVNFGAKINNSRYYFEDTPLYPLDPPAVANDSIWNALIPSRTAPDNATLDSIRFRLISYEGGQEKEGYIPNPQNGSFIMSITNETGAWINITKEIEETDWQPRISIFNDTQVQFILYPEAYRGGPTGHLLNEGSIFEIRFVFRDDISRTLIDGLHIVGYCQVGETPEEYGCIRSRDLRDGVLKVSIW